MISMIEPVTEFNLESPGGLVKVKAQCSQNQVNVVTLDSMPSFVGFTNRKVFVKSINDYVHVDCAFGGMWYVIVDVDDLNPKLPKIVPDNGRCLAQLGEEIKVRT